MKNQSEQWQTIKRVGYEGKQKDTNRANWNQEYGLGNWRLSWQYANGRLASFDDLFKEYVKGYGSFLEKNILVAGYVARACSFTWDKELITKEQAFQPRYLVDIPGKATQFHHVALNIALEKRLSIPFVGSEPVQVRLGKPTKLEFLHPGNIACISPELIPKADLENVWWESGSVEDLYQRSKVLQVRIKEK